LAKSKPQREKGLICRQLFYMELEGNLRKMEVSAGDPVLYGLAMADVLDKMPALPLNDCLGKAIRLHFTGQIHCVVTGRRINKTFGEGMSYEAWMNAPEAVESIIHPELDQSHLGIGIRDLEWERRRHVRPHYVYLALTSDIKVGVTRDLSVPSRWIDQGAWKVSKFAQTPYRQKAGAIEVALKNHISDKTNWRKMLQNECSNMDICAQHERLKQLLPPELQQYVLEKCEVETFNYPVLKYPQKVTSLKLDTTPTIEKKLTGIRGQYLIFEDDTVINLRSHSGYRVVFTC
jgi:hypothetical protein